MLKISGAISGANYISLPSKKAGVVKSLGLNGRYVILFLKISGLIIRSSSLSASHLSEACSLSILITKSLGRLLRFQSATYSKLTRYIVILYGSYIELGSFRE